MKLVETQVIVLERKDKYLKRALKIALDNGVTVYDAYDALYITQAEEHGETLTSDEKQAKAAESLGILVHYVE